MPTAELEQLATLEAQPAPADPGDRGPQARAEHRGRRGRARQAAGAGRSAPVRGQQARAASRSSSSRSSSTAIEHQRTTLLLTLPNLPHASVPVGQSAADNVGSAPLRRAARVRLRAEGALGSRPGARHPRLRARDARFRRAVLGADAAPARGSTRALINFMLDLHTTRARLHARSSRRSWSTARRCTAPATCRSSKQDLFKIAGDWDLYLIPTAEVPLTNLHRGEILDGRHAAAAATPPTRRASAARPARTAPTCAA